MPKVFFRTSDLALAAFLRLQDYLINDVHTESGRASFSFEDDTKRESLVFQFFNRKTTVEPLAFLEQIRNLKSLIRQNGVSVRPRENVNIREDR